MSTTSHISTSTSTGTNNADTDTKTNNDAQADAPPASTASAPSSGGSTLTTNQPTLQPWEVQAHFLRQLALSRTKDLGRQILNELLPHGSDLDQPSAQRDGTHIGPSARTNDTKVNVMNDAQTGGPAAVSSGSTRPPLCTSAPITLSATEPCQVQRYFLEKLAVTRQNERKRTNHEYSDRPEPTGDTDTESGDTSPPGIPGTASTGRSD